MNYIIKKIRKIKWILHWSIFGFLVLLFVIMAIYFEDAKWIGNVLQTIGTISGIYLTLIIFLQSKEESDKQFREQIEHLHIINSKHIEAIQISTEKQITTLQELTAKQIEALQNATEKQIEALQQTTNDEISAFEQQISEVTNRLTDNSILLAEILGRELEKSLELVNNTLIKEEAKFNDLNVWKFLRTREEKEQQLNKQWNRIEQVKKGYDYLVNKYKQLKQFLGIEQKKLIE